LSPRARIAGTGKYLPEKVLTNADLEKLVDTSDTWIQERTGVRERHIAADHESSSSMGIEAAKQALDQADIGADELDLVIGATTTPDGMFPASAAHIQVGLGAKRAGAFDVNAACVGFLSALAVGSQFIETGTYKNILVVGTEVLSRMTDWTDRTTCVLFGDAAGAVVLTASERAGPISFVLHNDGAGADKLFAFGPTSRPSDRDHGYFITMDGPHIFKFAVQAMEAAAREALAKAHLGVDDVDLLVPHQANLRIIKATAKGLGLPEERAMINVDRYGNTSSASIPVALREAWEQNRLHDGDTVVLMTFGGGLAWGSMVLEWAPIGRTITAAEPAHAIAGGGN